MDTKCRNHFLLADFGINYAFLKKTGVKQLKTFETMNNGNVTNNTNTNR